MKQLLRRLRRRFGFLHAPRVAVRVQVPWFIRWFGIASLCAGVALVTWWGTQRQFYQATNTSGDLRRDLGETKRQSLQLERQNDELRTQLAAIQRKTTIDVASQSELTKSYGKAQEEIARLKEELALYQSSLQSGASGTGVSVQNFKIERDGAPNTYRYRLLITHKSQQTKEFKGQGLINVSFERAGKPTTIMLKNGAAGTTVMELSFRYYQQLEGSFKVEDGAVLKRVEFVVFEQGKDTPLLSSSATLS